MHEGKAISAALKAAFGDKPPCSTWIGVPSLADNDFLIEVEPSPVFLAG
jgi:enamine deaminase RidA (YjgF/YER057c/UK114 family)